MIHPKVPCGLFPRDAITRGLDRLGVRTCDSLAVALGLYILAVVGLAAAVVCVFLL